MSLTSEARAFKKWGFSTLTFPFATWKQRTLRFQGFRQSRDGRLNPWMATWRKAFYFPHLDGQGGVVVWRPGSLSHHIEESLLLSLCSLSHGQEINFSGMKPSDLAFTVPTASVTLTNTSTHSMPGASHKLLHWTLVIAPHGRHYHYPSFYFPNQ